VQLDRERIDLKQFVEEIADEAEIYTTRFGIAFAMGPVQGAWIVGDALKLRRVLLNLIDNAVKYNKPGGEVTLSLLADDDFASISVRDTGIGIPADALHKIFDRFYRVDREHSRSLGGTGLGLYIVQWIIQNHGGEVLVESRLGEGSEFILKIPLDHTVAA
jgi:signal transduction histidine kinase